MASGASSVAACVLTTSQASAVRTLYKELLNAAVRHPLGREWCKDQFKAQYAKVQGDYTDRQDDFETLIGRGEWFVREVWATVDFHKYRTIKRRYDL